MTHYTRAVLVITLAAFALLAWLAWLDRPRTPEAVEKAKPEGAGNVVNFEKRKTA